MPICDCVDILHDDNPREVIAVYRSKRERRITRRSNNKRAITRLKRQILLTNIQIFKELVKRHVVRTEKQKQKLEFLWEKKRRLLEQLVSKKELLSFLKNNSDL